MQPLERRIACGWLMMAVFSLSAAAANDDFLYLEQAATGGDVATPSVSGFETPTTREISDSLAEQSEMIRQLLQRQCAAPPSQDCGGSSCCITPGWSVAADVLFMTRTRVDGQVVAVDQFAPTDVLLNASDFGFNYEVGPRISLTRHTRTGCDLELIYFGIDAWNDRITTPSAVFILTGGGNFGLAGTPAFRYGTELYSGEFNITSPQRGMFRVLAGARMLELNESFIGGTTGNPNFYAIETSNQLYGFQAGADIKPINLDQGSLSIRVTGGPYHNNTRVNATVGGGTPDGSDRARSLTFVGEMALTGVVRVTDWLSIRAGYQIMLVDDVALAVNQFATHDSVADTIDVVGGSSLLFHGGFAGLALRW